VRFCFAALEAKRSERSFCVLSCVGKSGFHARILLDK